MRTVKSYVALAILLGSSALAHAGPGDEPRFYIGSSFGKSNVSSHTVDESGDPSFGFMAGYQVNRNVAVEVFTRSLSFRMVDGLFGDDSYYPDIHYGVAVLGRVPLNEHFSVFGRLGLGRTSMESARVSRPDYKVTDSSVGLGIEYAFNKRWSVNLEATRFNKTDVSNVMFGVVHRF